MPEENKSAVERRIDNGVYGTPKIKPDEQRKYLGTFRERVCLTISVAQLQERDWTPAVTAELAKKIGTLVFINGNLPHDQIHPYIQAAVQAGATFTLKNEPDYKTDPDSLAVVIANKTAVYQTPVNVEKRYADLQENPSQPEDTEEHHGFFHRLFHKEGH
ncbi:MAG: YueI family protein [Limosilactobacillus sp.]|uniref:YueI family protein n=1 Tax=Limosilactobacillus sp. TaxID=2773925 RepID=UPI00270A539D|nr:YueI family protein [Limosilactobacillus sp.]